MTEGKEETVLFPDNGKRRIMTKEGKCAIRKSHRLEKPYLYHLSDIVSSLMECRWRYLFLWFAFFNLVTWYLFAVVWWLIAFAHDDLRSSPRLDLSREPCVTEVRDMINAFMFSMETQYTTGYGSRTPTTECPEAVFMLCVQNLVGMILQCSSLGIIFAKLSRPKARSLAIKFSEKAVIAMRDGYLCLMFRIADIRKSHVICCDVKGWVLKSHLTEEGELLAQYRHRLTLTVDAGGSDTFLVWPVTVVHKIDQDSPLYNVSAHELYNSDIEIVASLTCTIESTGQQVEVRRSYVPREILWGHRFKHIIRRTGNNTKIDYNMFDRTVEVDTALSSAKTLQLYRWSATKPNFNLGNLDPTDHISVSRQISKERTMTPNTVNELLCSLSSFS